MANTTTELPQLVDISQLAERLAVDVRHVRRLVAERRIPFIKWGHLLRFDPEEVRVWLDSHRQDPRPARWLSQLVGTLTTPAEGLAVRSASMTTRIWRLGDDGTAAFRVGAAASVRALAGPVLGG